MKWLAVLPCAGILAGPFVLNRVEPLVFGLPQLLAWLVACVIATSAIMGLVYLCDPQARAETRRTEKGGR